MLLLLRRFDTGARILAYGSNYVCSLIHAPMPLGTLYDKTNEQIIAFIARIL